MLEDEEFAMRRQFLALLAAGAAALAVMAESLPAEARPLGSGWSAGRTSVGWGGARHRGVHRGYRHGFKGWPVEVVPGFSGGRYLSDDSWFLSDIGGYLADPPYPHFGGYGYGYGNGYGYAHPYPVHYRRAGHGYRAVSYAVPVYRAAHASRRVVTVHRGARGIHRAAFRPGRHAGH
jgi:hypothetical protein